MFSWHHLFCPFNRYAGIEKGPATFGVIKRLRDNDMELHTDRQVQYHDLNLLLTGMIVMCKRCKSRSNWSLWTKPYGITIQMKATEQYFPVVLFIMLYKVVLTFESVDKILWCDHSNKTFFGWTFRWYCYFSAFYENFRSSHRVHLFEEYW